MRNWLRALGAAPLTIKIAISFYLSVALFLAFSMASVMIPFGLFTRWDGPRVLAITAGPYLVGALYALVGLPRLSRWPLLVAPLAVVLRDILLSIGNGEGLAGAGFVTSPLSLWPVIIFLLLALPHWRKMNWSLLGRAGSGPPDESERMIDEAH